MLKSEGNFLSRRLALHALNGALISETGWVEEKLGRDAGVPPVLGKEGVWSLLVFQIYAIQGVVKPVSSPVMT